MTIFGQQPVSILSEISGAFGDLGTFLPILVALSSTNQASPAASFVFGGAFNILTGVIYNIPMCVQPMKAIAAVALSTNLSQAQIVSAGMLVSATVFFLGATRLIHLVNTYIPLSVVRGIQLGAGITLISKGSKTILASNQLSFDNFKWTDNYIVAMLAFALTTLFYRAKFTPTALILFTIGIIVAIIQIKLSGNQMPHIDISFPSPSSPSPSDFVSGFVNAGLGQLPLTLLNSVIAVSKLADDLFPHNPSPVASVTSVSICVGIMNLIGGWFGSIPFCHGSGGLAAQYRFGARTGASIIGLGITKIIIGIFFGQSLIPLFQSIPKSILGVLLTVAGLELAISAKDLGPIKSAAQHQDKFTVMIVTAGGLIGFQNDGIGFLLGIIAHFLLNLSNKRQNDASKPIEKDQSEQV